MDKIQIRAFIKGIASCIPGIGLMRRHEGGGANYARYCYSVWLRHLKMVHAHGLPTVPGVVAELGPGDSLGIGIAALLSGAKTYHAFDVVHFIRREKNLGLYEEILDLLRKRSSVPDDREFPEVFPRVDSYAFPAWLDNDNMAFAQSPERLAAVRAALSGKSCSNALISYSVPWNDQSLINESSVDLILSQAVLEHVDNIDQAYAAMFRWLKPGGFISHEIDFKSHGTSRQWYGHWCFGDRAWRIVRGNRPYFLNRQPLSFHLRCIKNAGLTISYVQRQTNPVDFKEYLARPFSELDNYDLETSSAYVIARKEIQ